MTNDVKLNLSSNSINFEKPREYSVKLTLALRKLGVCVPNANIYLSVSKTYKAIGIGYGARMYKDPNHSYYINFLHLK